VALLVSAAPLLAHEPVGSDSTTAMQFVPPAPGTYRLQRIMTAPDGRVVDVDGHPARLRRFTTGKITVLSFIYTGCTDAHGCPLAYGVLQSLRERLQRAPALRDRVRLVTLSFDPLHDTPAAMRRYAGGGDRRGVPWAFLTTRSAGDLRPLLDGFGQDVGVQTEAATGLPGPAGPLAHVLKVFLIDPGGVVREIYTTSYLFPQVVLNDIETLRLESAGAKDSGSARNDTLARDGVE